MNHRCKLSLYVAITPHPKGSEVITIAHEYGLGGVTALLGVGTRSSGILGFLGLNNTEKDIVLLAADSHSGDIAMQAIALKMDMAKPNKGIIFSMPIESIVGTTDYCNLSSLKEEVHLVEYQAIYTIVDKGRGEEVVEAACKAGAKGGTILNARGSGIHETQTLFHIAIEPEKEMVLVIAPISKVPSIVSSIREEMHLDDPGKGILFVMDVRNAIGLYRE
ncbi:MAG: P-II family nitrogen regulator [Candidatus Izemoplasmatales bacterium]|jgi:nitrogen regulatory protein PII|nr:P-II family nitrogen regulator [Candidatus Izemoplasmatales bacterium]